MPAEQQQIAREYELVYILRPTIGPSDSKKVSDRITSVIDKQGAKLTHVDNWGKRKLAYPIRRHTRGVFVYVKFAGVGDVVSELERNLRILDDVMRYQTVRLGEVPDFGELQVDSEEVQFRDIELGEDEEEPTFEERLGMKSRERERERERKPEAEETEAPEAAEASDKSEEEEPSEEQESEGKSTSSDEEE